MQSIHSSGKGKERLRMSACSEAALFVCDPPARRRTGEFSLLLSDSLSGMHISLFQCIWHKSNVSCSLYRNRQSSLMLCAVSGNSSRKDFSSLRNISLQHCRVLVIDHTVLVSTEHTNFLSSASAFSLHLRISLVTFIKCHGGILLQSFQNQLDVLHVHPENGLSRFLCHNHSV